MRPTIRLLAKVKPSKYLEPFAPTGLAGLVTHPSPRPTLIFLYKSTLEKLQGLPESSVYRKSTEAVTQQRLKIIESTRPPGYDAWLERVQKVIAEDPERYKGALRTDGTYAALQQKEVEGRGSVEWDGEPFDPKTEGPYRTEEEMANLEREINEDMQRAEKQDLHWEAEPALESAQ
jgi:NADH dehydrogenase (ubiquinone) 1 alpha subcomplex subunit 5